MSQHQACHCCGLIHLLPELNPGETANCTRCHAVILREGAGQKSAQRTAAAALGAFALFWPAILLPILEIEKLGHHHEASLVSGIAELFAHHNYFVGGVVLLFSIIFPLTKIAMLLELSLLKLLHQRHKAITYRVMEVVGKWSMMDVLLLAFMVMLVKLGNLVEFHFGPAVFAFVACVAMSMLASMSFDPHGIWEDEHDG